MGSCHDELGFRRVRFHGILNDDMSVWTGDEACPYSFFNNVDVLIDFLLEIGMKPFIELSFMPEELASGPETSSITGPTSPRRETMRPGKNSSMHYHAL